MLIGIISDSHDNLVNLEKALVILQARKVEHILHAGDYVSPFTARVLKKFTGGFTGIFGNNDGEKLFLRKMFNDTIHPQPHILTLHDRKIVMMHEHDLVDALADSGHFDLVVYGHTHEPDIRQRGNALIVNPGELSGWLHGRSTVAVVDLTALSAELIEL